MYHSHPSKNECKAADSQVTNENEKSVSVILEKTSETKKTLTPNCIFSSNVTSPVNSLEKKDWWSSAVIYEVYVRSFYDASGDGVGDLKGLTEKLDYFTDVLGVQALWITPVYPSPMVDFGYDITNFMDIDPIFGSLNDFKNLQKAMKQRELKLILDIVPNHTSDQHPWFIKSIYKEEPYTNYYIWKPAKALDENGKPLPPNNWVSVFGKSMWEWNEIRREFYLHQFAKEQPDLNFRNSAVLEEMLNVFKFYLDLGVDGFRVDALPHLFEDPKFRDQLPLVIRNDEEKEASEFTPEEYSFWNHELTYNLPETLDVLKRIRDLCDDYSSRDNIERIVMTEGYLSVQEVMKYYGSADRKLAHFPFNFELLNCSMTTKSIAKNLFTGIKNWFDHIPPGCVSNWLIGNHDQPRVGSRLNANLIDAMNIINLLLPGTAITYYGEELGMLNVDISWKDTLDPSGINAGEDKYHLYTRDPCRTPMQWSSSSSAGFTKFIKPWLTVHSNFKVCNVEVEKSDPDSHLNMYRKLMELRKLKAIKEGGLELMLHNTNELFGFVRFTGEMGILVLINFGETEIVVDATCFQSIVNSKATIIVSTYPNPPGSRFDRITIANMKAIPVKSQEAQIIEAIRLPEN